MNHDQFITREYESSNTFVAGSKSITVTNIIWERLTVHGEIIESHIIGRIVDGDISEELKERVRLSNTREDPTLLSDLQKELMS